METILQWVQIATLVTVIIYVIKTWQIASATRKAAEASEASLKEMKDARDQETAPDILVYFDLPLGEHIVYLVIKNIGRSIAKNVRIKIEPELAGTHRGDNFNDLPLAKTGIASLPPENEVRAFIDTTASFFGEHNTRPLTYSATVQYEGGINNLERLGVFALDLTHFRGLSSIQRHSIHDLVNRVEKLSRSNEQISKDVKNIFETLSSGLLIKNPTILFSQHDPLMDYQDWLKVVRAKLREYVHLWSAVYGGDHKKVYHPFSDELVNRIHQIGEQIGVLLSSHPSEVTPALLSNLTQIAIDLNELSGTEFFIGGDSYNKFDENGAQLITSISTTIQSLETTIR